MEKNQNNKEYYSIDLLHILRTLWKKAWIICVSAIVIGAVGFSLAAFVITPQYSSSVMLYVNNGTFDVGGIFEISSSEISAAQSLLKTYIVMLQNRTTLERVIEKADVSYTYKELGDMIHASSVNDTEVLQITVTCDDPYEAAKIVNVIAEVLPRRISEIIEGSTMEVVDYGAVNTNKVSPSIPGYTAVGMFVGAFIAIAIIALLALLDDTIRDEDYVLQNYDYPILAKIPNLVVSDTKSYRTYYQKHKSS